MGCGSVGRGLYERLPPARRASLHLRIGEREEAGHGARAAERASVLAVHFEGGRDARRALRYRQQAAEQALQRCAYPEAVEHLTHGRRLLDAVPDERERLDLELELQMMLGPALIALRGSGSPEVEAVYARARELADGPGHAAARYPALWGSWFVNYSRGSHAVAREMGERLLELAEREGDTGRLLEAHHALWATLIAMGDPGAAVAHIEHGQRLYDPARHRSQAVLYGSHDAGTCSWYHLATARWLLGYPDAALAAIREARALSETLDHPATTIIRLCSTGWVHYHRGDHDDALKCAQDAVTLATAHGFRSYVDDGEVLLACVIPGQALPEESLVTLYQRLRGLGPGRAAWRDVSCLAALARAASERAQVELGLEILAAVSDEQRAAFFGPEILRLRGELLLQRDERDEAGLCFRRALAMARDRGERSLELRAAMSLARLLARRKRRDEARQVLRQTYGWFTEGFETRDLREARALLEQLGGA